MKHNASIAGRRILTETWPGTVAAPLFRESDPPQLCQSDALSEGITLRRDVEVGHHRPMSKVTLTTELPIAADVACALARTPALFAYVVAPILSMPHIEMPDRMEPGVEGSARIWWFGIVPAWTHHLRLVRSQPRHIYTNEWGGPARTWNHSLTFEPIGESRCRYTDEIEIDDGLHGLGIRLFARVLFRHRHRRWRQLARVLATDELEIRTTQPL